MRKIIQGETIQCDPLLKHIIQVLFHGMSAVSGPVMSSKDIKQIQFLAPQTIRLGTTEVL